MSTRAVARAFGAVVVLGTLISLAVTTVHAKHFPPILPSLLSASCPTGFANFGDSFTDTGNYAIAFPYSVGFNADFSPIGESFFGDPTKRFSNGRLVPDFFCQAFGKPLLDPYFSLASFNHRNGVNFASAGSPAAMSPDDFSLNFALKVQTSQFVRFKRSVAATRAQLGCYNFNAALPSPAFQSNPYSSWLYTIKSGLNDIYLSYLNKMSISWINDTRVPNAAAGISDAISSLYDSGARQFLVFGVSAAGCTPAFLTNAESSPLDNLGCRIDVNSVVQNLNSQMLDKIITLRRNLPGASIAYFDYYKANIAILNNPKSFGFSPNLTRTACCGYGNGEFNYNAQVSCGTQGSNNCKNPDEYINWDGIHLTEAFYRLIAKFALEGKFTDGGRNYAKSCFLDFSKFASGVTFKKAYPFQKCNNLYA